MKHVGMSRNVHVTRHPRIAACFINIPAYSFIIVGDGTLTKTSNVDKWAGVYNPCSTHTSDTTTIFALFNSRQGCVLSLETEIKSSRLDFEVGAGDL